MKQISIGLLCVCMVVFHNLYAADNSTLVERISSPDTGWRYNGLNITLGGFLASETIERRNNAESDIATTYSKIPFQNSAGYDQSEFRGTERQSRFSLLVQGDVNESTHIAGFYEIDFLGTSPTANPNQSNSFTPRTRNVYMTMDWDDIGFHILAGQNWSLVTQNSKGITPRSEYIPATIDAQYAVGFNWARQWQFRMVKDWGKKYWAALSFENAQTVGVAGTVATGTGNTYQLPAGSLYNPSSNMSINAYPDLIAKFAAETDFGHYEIYDLAKNIQSDYGGTSTSTQTNRQNIWTNAVGAAARVPVYPKVIELLLSGLFGKGIGRYGTSSLSDATYASDGRLEPLNSRQYLVQLAWHANPEWEAYAAFGQESLDQAVGVDNTYGYGDGVVSSNAGCSTVGGSCNPLIRMVSQGNIGFWWSFYKGSFGVAKLGGQFSHTRLTTYGDTSGFAPSTTEDMVFTSLRYYPF